MAALSNVQLEAAEIKAEEIGTEHGNAAASWVEINDSLQASLILAGIKDCDPEIMDLLPQADLSGQWADGYLPQDLLSDCGIEEDDEIDYVSDLADAYDRGFALAVETAVALRCAALLNETV